MLDAGNIHDLPCVTVTTLLRYDFCVIAPIILVLPSIRHVNYIAGTMDGDGFLDTPTIVKHERPTLLVIFESDHTARARSRNPDDLDPLIGKQFTGIWRCLNGIFFFYFVFVTFVGDAPCPEKSQFSLGIKMDLGSTEIAAFRCEYLDHSSVSCMDLTVVGNGGDFFIEQDHSL